MQVGDAYLIVYSITDRASFEKASELRIQLRRARQTEDIPIILVGNKSDLVRCREVSVSGERLCDMGSAPARHTLAQQSVLFPFPCKVPPGALVGCSVKIDVCCPRLSRSPSFMVVICVLCILRSTHSPWVFSQSYFREESIPRNLLTKLSGEEKPHMYARRGIQG